MISNKWGPDSNTRSGESSKQPGRLSKMQNRFFKPSTVWQRKQENKTAEGQYN